MASNWSKEPKREMYAETTVMVLCDVLLSGPLSVSDKCNIHMERYEWVPQL